MLDKRSWKRLEWTLITDRKLSWFEIEGGFCGAVEMLDVSEPFCVGKDRLTICDEGITWIQCAWHQKHLWATAMFDKEGRLFQIYFDIADEVHLDGEDSWFVDLIVDVVYNPSGQAVILDCDELESAYNNKRISLAQKELAQGCSMRLKTVVENEYKQVNQWFETLYKKVKKIL